jgi:hypothetical protein
VITGALAHDVHVATAGRQQQRPIAGASSVAVTASTPTRPQTPHAAWRLGAQSLQMSGCPSRARTRIARVLPQMPHGRLGWCAL